MSSILNTGLDRETLSVCVSLCESGVNPEALAVRPKFIFAQELSSFFFLSKVVELHLLTRFFHHIQAVIKELRRESASTRVSNEHAHR